jgi:hypothetical protein
VKTSILVSGFAALCLLVTFAEAPRRHREDKMNVASKDNISIEIVKKAIVLPGIVITNYGNNEAGIALPDIPAADFIYLKFDAAKYMETDAINQEETEVLLEASETDFSYLKFKISDFQTDSEINGVEMPELPVNENNVSTFSKPEPVVNEFVHLRFSCKNFIANSLTDSNDIGDLPLDEAKTGNQVQITTPGETANRFGSLKFDVTHYYSSANLSSDEHFELPEE